MQQPHPRLHSFKYRSSGVVGSSLDSKFFVSGSIPRRCKNFCKFFAAMTFVPEVMKMHCAGFFDVFMFYCMYTVNPPQSGLAQPLFTHYSHMPCGGYHQKTKKNEESKCFSRQQNTGKTFCPMENSNQPQNFFRREY